MPLLSLPAIEERVNELARRLGAPGDLLPAYGRTDDFARPHVEVDARLRTHPFRDQAGAQPQAVR